MKLLLIFIYATILGLAAPAGHAKIGDTEIEVLVSHAGETVTRDTINERAKVIVFTTEKTQYAVGVLDGKVESEVFTNNDDTKPDKKFVLDTLHAYGEVWFPVGCDKNCAAVMSADGNYFAKIGPSKELRKQWVFWVFSEAWRVFAKERGPLKDREITL